MKQFIQLFSIFILFTFQLKSQNYISVRLGMSSMHVTESAGTASGNYDSRTGLNTSLGFELGLSEYLAFNPELNFTNKGYKFSQPSQQINVMLNYIELPLILRPRISIEEILEIYGEVGPSFAIGIGGEAVANGVSYSDVFGAGGYNNFDFGFNYGAGANFILGSRYKLGIGMRFYRGLGNLYPNNTANIEGKNNGFILGVNFYKEL